MRYLLVTTAALLFSVFASAPARADFVFQFTDTSGNAQSNFTVAQGSTVGVSVYLLEFNGATPATVLTSQGLSSAGVALTYAAGSPATVQNAAAITPNAAFDLSQSP